MEKQIQEIKSCLPNGSHPERMVLKLIINPDRTVRAVNFILKIDAGARKCILKITEKWRCQATQDGLQGEVAVAVVPGH